MKPDLNDALYILGIGLVATGAWLVYRPSAFLASGLIVLALARLGVGRR